jgi:hypothetical protein
MATYIYYTNWKLVQVVQTLEIAIPGDEGRAAYMMEQRNSCFNLKTMELDHEPIIFSHSVL